MVRINTLILVSLLISFCSKDQKEMNPQEFEKLAVEEYGYVKKYSEKPDYQLQVNKQDCRVIIETNANDCCFLESGGEIPFNMMTQQGKRQSNTPIYTLKVSVANPYEIYVNDMPFDKSYETGSLTFELPINDFILHKGQQLIKIILLPEKGQKIVDKLGLDFFNAKVFKYKNLASVGTDGELVKEIQFKDSLQLSVATKEVAIEYVDVPYSLNGWSNSVDLTKENRPKLESEVLSKFNELRDLLNKGDLQGFLVQNKKRDEEVDSSFYNDEDAEKEDMEYLRNRVAKSENHMESLKDFTIKFYGDGNVVTLEGKNGKSALLGDDGKNIYYYMVLLHRPYQNAPLQIIR